MATEVHVRDEPVGQHAPGVKSAYRVIDIFELLAESANGLTVSEISMRLGIARSSTHGLVHTLLRRGYLTLDNSGGKRFRLGVGLIQLGLSVVDQIDLRSATRSELERLVAETDETAFLAVPHHAELVYVDKVISGVREFRADPRMGARRPMYCTSLGKALLATLDEESVLVALDRIGMPPATRFSITDKKALLEDLAKTRKRGYAIDRQEAMIGICCAGAPIRDHLGRPVAAISVSTMRDLFDAEKLGQAVAKSAIASSRRLGWRGDARELYAPVPGSLGVILGNDRGYS